MCTRVAAGILLAGCGGTTASPTPTAPSSTASIPDGLDQLPPGVIPGL